MANAKPKKKVKTKQKETKNKKHEKIVNKKSRANKKNKLEKKQINFEFLEHTADAKFRAYGKTFEEALKSAAKATIAVMTDIAKISPKSTKKIIAEANTKEALLYDFLEEIIYLVDTEGFLLCNVKKITITSGIDSETYKYVLKAELAGDLATKYDVHTYIKAVTYNDMKIDEKKGKVMIQVVLDI
jgi:SHS2 domain-containing protein